MPPVAVLSPHPALRRRWLSRRSIPRSAGRSPSGSARPPSRGLTGAARREAACDAAPRTISRPPASVKLAAQGPTNGAGPHAVTTIEPGAMASHPRQSFAALRVSGSISDYAVPENGAAAVYARGQQAGQDPQLVARAILRVIRTDAPARCNPVGTIRRG
jgi:hypothetical protein